MKNPKEPCEKRAHAFFPNRQNSCRKEFWNPGKGPFLFSAAHSPEDGDSGRKTLGHHFGRLRRVAGGEKVWSFRSDRAAKQVIGW